MASSIHLSLGGISMSLDCTDDRIECVLDAPLRQFVTPPSDPEVRLTVTASDGHDAAEGRLLFDSGAVWRLFEDRGGYRIECRSDLTGDRPYKVATFDSTFTRGEIAIRLDATGTAVDPLEYPLDELLVSNLLARGRGVELHSCGLIDEKGRGHLFVGVSGAGKTTTARLWEGKALVLSDDRVIIRSVDGTYRIFGTPWHGEADLCASESAPLAGIYLLSQAETTELRDIAPSEAVARLFGCTFPLFHDQTALAFTLEFLDGLVKTIPVRELCFTPDSVAVEAVLSGTSLPA